MKNGEVADLLEKLADLVEANGEDRFKVVAYRRAATSIRNLKEDVEDAWKAGELRDIRYVGEGIAKKVDEYLRTGRLGLVETLSAKIPGGVPQLMKVPGVGPRIAYRLSHDLGITGVAELKGALESGVLDTEFGPAVRAALIQGIEFLETSGSRMLLPEAEASYETLRAYFGALGIEVRMAGSLRRAKSTVGDIDILSTNPRVIDAIKGCPGVTEVIEAGAKRTSVRLQSGARVDVRSFAQDEYGAALLYFTGSKEHNIALRNIAISKGWKLNEYGLFAKDGTKLAGASEEEVYTSLGMEYTPPELREDRGEVQAAQEGRLPRLVEFDQLKGDLQMHSTWSDGRATLEEMARGAASRGYEYIAVTDHSASVRVANGLTEERFRAQWEEIDRLNDELSPFRILKGVELEIRRDGSLDFDDAFLEGFELVGASLHQNFRQDAEQLTERAVMALRHPSVDFLCHPTNRLIGKREGNPMDLERVIRTARENNKMLEIDGQPRRLDLDESWAARAMEEGVTLLVDSDAHSVGELDNVAYGVSVARRGWLEAAHVANTRELKGLMRLLSR